MSFLRRGVLLGVLLSGLAAAQSSAAYASSEGTVTTVLSSPVPLPAFLAGLGRQVAASVVVLPGVPETLVAYQFARLPWPVAWSTVTGAHGLAFCRSAALLVVGLPESAARTCAAVDLQLTTPGAPQPVTVAPLPDLPPLEGFGVRVASSSVSAKLPPPLPDFDIPAPVPVLDEAPVVAGPVLPVRYPVRVRLLEIADNSSTAGGVDWSANLLSNLLGAGVSALTGGAFLPADLTKSISALEQQGTARKLDDVALVLTSGRSTQFRSGGTLQLSLLGGGDSKIERNIQYGLTLDLEPVALDDGSVSLTVSADLSSPASVSNPQLLDLTSRSVSSQVTARPGSGVVVAAFTSVRDERTGAGLPGVSSVPVVGWLAGRASASSARSTVVVTLELV